MTEFYEHVPRTRPRFLLRSQLQCVIGFVGSNRNTTGFVRHAVATLQLRPEFSKGAQQ